MSYRIKDPDTGEFITIANGSRMFVGTTAAIDAAIARGELKYPDLYACTDDYPSKEGVGELTAGALTPSNSSYAYKNGHLVVSSGTLNTSANVSAWTTLFTLPFKPIKSLQVVLYEDVTNTSHLASILAGGEVQLHKAITVSSNTNLFWNFTYASADEED